MYKQINYSLFGIIILVVLVILFVILRPLINETFNGCLSFKGPRGDKGDSGKLVYEQLPELVQNFLLNLSKDDDGIFYYNKRKIVLRGEPDIPATKNVNLGGRPVNQGGVLGENVITPRPTNSPTNSPTNQPTMLTTMVVTPPLEYVPGLGP